jgi:hypothetical protein
MLLHDITRTINRLGAEVAGKAASGRPSDGQPPGSGWGSARRSSAPS